MKFRYIDLKIVSPEEYINLYRMFKNKYPQPFYSEKQQERYAIQRLENNYVSESDEETLEKLFKIDEDLAFRNRRIDVWE